MIISRTPFRISFFGGGTDYPAWYKSHGGSVLSAAIDKYCYLTVRVLPPFFEHRHRIVWSRVETVQEIAEIQHPAVRAALEKFNIRAGMEIHHDADLPARSGLGSSSSFMVGLLHSLHAMQGRMISQDALAKEAIHFEQDILKENVGSQDQIAAAFGGFNRIIFHPDGSFAVMPITLPRDRMQELQDSIVLVYSGISRFASEIAKDKVQNMVHRVKELTSIHEMVDEALKLLQDPRESIERIGLLMQDSWKLKRSLASSVSNALVDEIFQSALDAGASGGKLMGAGGGGFFMFLVRPALQKQFLERMQKFVRVRVGFDGAGSRIVYYGPSEIDYASLE